MTSSSSSACLRVHLSHPVGHLGLYSQGELEFSVASSHFYVFCCLVELKRKKWVGVWVPHRTHGGKERWLRRRLVKTGMWSGGLPEPASKGCKRLVLVLNAVL